MTNIFQINQNQNNNTLFGNSKSKPFDIGLSGLFSNININQEDDEHCCVVLNDEKTELSQIRESENESQSGTESAFKSRKNSQLNLNNLRDNSNTNEEKKQDEFLRPHDININNRNEPNFNLKSNKNFFNNNNINYQMDFEDEVNQKYGLFPIV